MSKSGYYLGIDGGGTWGYVLIEKDGEESLRLATGPLNINSVPATSVRESLLTLARELADAGYAIEDCLGVGLGVAGISNPGAAPIFEESFKAAGFTCPVHLSGDADIALLEAFGRQGPGLLLIAGTGSVAMARNEEGGLTRSGGFGDRLDDRGSGYALGRVLLTTAAKTLDGRASSPRVLSAVARALQLPGAEAYAASLQSGETDELPDKETRTAWRSGIIAWTYGEGTGKREIAALSRLLAEDPELLEDPAIRRALEEEADELAEMCRACLAGAKAPVPMAVTGGVLTGLAPLRQMLEAAIRREQLPVAKITVLRESVHGAVMLAKGV